ncbi:WhiB family redox-sensing transcriptional regulator [Streptomyces sp. 846.5]|nr:WhiB family transcriptional regulator [Streptomyces sp. 846.5]TDT97914.1 WhiB family redox-sensing transcriptional regulator [Streptomyces sp. 846.5]
MGSKPELPGAVEWAWQWHDQAACAHLDSHLFFHPAGERGENFAARERAAKQICGACPVLGQCRQYALAAREPYGVWGGLSEDERAGLLRRRRPAHRRLNA